MLLEPLRGGRSFVCRVIIELYDMPEAMRLLCVRDVIERLVPTAAAIPLSHERRSAVVKKLGSGWTRAVRILRPN
jgi:hypothetical protein